MDTVDRDIGEVTISNKSCSMSTIMLDIIDHVDSNSLVSFGGRSAESKVLEHIEVIHAFHFLVFSINPLGVAILFVKSKGILVVSCNLNSTLELGSCSMRSEFGLVGHPQQLLLSSGNPLEPLPTRGVKQSIVCSMDCTGDRVIFGNVRQRFGSDLPILPFNHDIEG